MSEPVEISKIIFNPLNKNYSIHFRSLSSKKYFDYIVSADNAKKISMSSEGINSSMLSPYELYIELLDFMKFRINKILIFKKSGKVISKINLVTKNKENHEFILNLTDAIILSLKTYSNIYISKSLLETQEIEVEEEIIMRDKKTDKSNLKNKLLSLEKAMKESIKSESYETAAFLRDRINSLKDSE